MSRSGEHWQRALRDYLLSGDAVIIRRATDSGMSPRTWEAIRSGGVLAAQDGQVVYRVNRRSSVQRAAAELAGYQFRPETQALIRCAYLTASSFSVQAGTPAFSPTPASATV